MTVMYLYPKSYYDEVVSFAEHPDSLKNIAYLDLGMATDVDFDRHEALVRGCAKIVKAIGSVDFILYMRTDGFSSMIGSILSGPEAEGNHMAYGECAFHSDGEIYIAHSMYYQYTIRNGVKYYNNTHTREEVIEQNKSYNVVLRHSKEMFWRNNRAFYIPKGVFYALM